MLDNWELNEKKMVIEGKKEIHDLGHFDSDRQCTMRTQTYDFIISQGVILKTLLKYLLNTMDFVCLK